MDASFSCDVAGNSRPSYASVQDRIRMLSQRAKYALRAMIRLAEYGEATPVSVTVLANDTQIPRAFLEQIFSELRRRNLVVSHRGKQGGFVLARHPKDITFAEIIRHVDGPLALAPCASRT